MRPSLLGQYTDTFSITTGVVGSLAAVLALAMPRIGGSGTIDRSEPSHRAQSAARVGVASLASPVVSPSSVVGRERLCRELVKTARARRRRVGNPRIHVLAGVGGVGKTTVAALVANVIKEAGHPVWWVVASSPESLENGMLSVAQSLNATDGEILRARSGEINGPDLVWSYLEGPNQPWLLVLCHADNPTYLGDLARGAIDGRGWLRSPRHGTVLVTSHHIDPSTWGSFARVHPLYHLTPEQGATILQNLAPAGGSVDDARNLAERLGSLPLALHLAGWYLASAVTPLQDFAAYHDALNDRFAEVIQRSSRIVGDQDDRGTIMTIWEVELDYLADQGMTAARKLLRLLSCYAKATPIPLRLINEVTLAASGLFAGERPGAIEVALDGLIKVGLVRPWQPPATSPDSSGVSAVLVDGLVAETNLAHLADDPESNIIVRRAAAFILALVTEQMSAVEQEYWSAWQALNPHIMTQLPWLGDDSIIADNALAAAYRTVWGLRWGALYPAAEELARASLQHAGAIYSNHPRALEIRRELATILRALGRNEESYLEFRAALDVSNSVLGPHNMHTLRTRHGLARVLRNLGRYSEAEQETRAVLDDRTREHGDQHEYTLSTRHELARVLTDLGRYVEAEREYRCVFEARIALLGSDSLWTLSTQHGLARVLRELGHHEEAEREIRAVVEARIRKLGEEHPHTLASRNEVARVLLDMHRFGEAENEYRQLLRVQSSQRKSSRLRMLAVQQGFARLLHDTSRIDDAENELSAVLGARTRLLGPAHPHTLSTRHLLATVWLDQGRRSESVHELLAVLEARTQVLGPEHPHTLSTRLLLATVRLDQGHRSEAVDELRAVLELRIRILGPEHPETARTRSMVDDLTNPDSA